MVFYLRYADGTVTTPTDTAQKMKFSIKNYFRKYDQIPSFLKKSLMEDFIFCAVLRNYYIKS